MDEHSIADYYQLYEKINRYLKEEYGIEVQPIYEKSDDYVFVIPLHKIKNISNEGCDKIKKKLEDSIGMSFSLDNCFLRVSYKNLFLNTISIPRFGNKERVIVEFSSPNIGKPFNVGHLRSTILGDSLSKLLSISGYNVLRMTYFGDWGLQFGKLIYAYKKYGDEKELEKRGIRYLFELYVRIHKDEEKDESIKEKGEEEFIKLENGDRENFELWKRFCEVSMREFKRIYDKLNISFDVYDSESNQVEHANSLIENLIKRKIAFIDEKDGSVLIPTPYGNLVIYKKGERTLYSTRDLIAIRFRCNKYNPLAILYVVGNEQQQYFEKIFYAAKKAGLCDSDLVHVDFGLLYLPEGKFSTRKGNVVFVDEFIDFLKEKIKEDFEKREKEILHDNLERLAINTIKFALLSQSRRKNFMFDVKKFTTFNNENAIYLVYTYARIQSLINKYKDKKQENELNQEKILKMLKENNASEKLLNFIYKFPFYIKKSIDNYDPHYLVIYSIELCKRYNTLYQNIRFIDNPKFEHAGMYLSFLVRDVLSIVFDIIGIKPLSKI